MHPHRKEAAKCRPQLDRQTFLPRLAMVDTSRHHDAKPARKAEVKNVERAALSWLFSVDGKCYRITPKLVAPLPEPKKQCWSKLARHDFGQVFHAQSGWLD